MKTKAEIKKIKQRGAIAEIRRTINDNLWQIKVCQDNASKCNMSGLPEELGKVMELAKDAKKLYKVMLEIIENENK